MLTPGLVTRRISLPQGRRNFELRADHAQERRRRLLGAIEDPPWVAQYTELYRDAQPVVRPAMLADEGEIGAVQRVVPYPLGLLERDGQKRLALVRRQQLTAWHGLPRFSMAG